MTTLLLDREGGKDFRFVIRRRHSHVLIVAPHGGNIEPETSQLAKAIAGDDFDLYCFEGLLPKGQNTALHVTSEHYDEPTCNEMVASSATVVAVHGLKEGDHIEVGGLNVGLRSAVVQSLRTVGFMARVDGSSSHGGMSSRNICNRGPGGGVQLEIPMAIRSVLKTDLARRSAFVSALRAAITTSRPPRGL